MLILRLTFGGVPNPNNFGLVSETICDLSNHFLLKSEWDHHKYISPIQDKVLSIESPTEYSPLSKALPMIVDVPTNPKGHVEIYTDDFMIAVDDIDDKITRAKETVHSTIHTMGRPLLSQ